jgi:hypothetical protein
LGIEKADDLTGFFVLLHPFFDEFAGVDHGAVVFSAKCVADIHEGGIGVLPREIHGDLARERDVRWASFARHVREAHIEMLRDAALDLIDRNGLASLFLKNVGV